MEQDMSEAPERIYARFATTGPGINIRKWSTSGFPEAEAEYLRANTAIPKAEADAMVAAAVKRAYEIADTYKDWAATWGEDKNLAVTQTAATEIRNEIRSQLEADTARAAFEQAVREAVEAEMEQVILWARQEQRFCTYHKDKAGEMAYAHLAERLERAAAIRAPQETSE